MIANSIDLDRCQALLDCAADAFDDALAAQPPRAALEAWDRRALELLARDIDRLAPMIPPPTERLLTERLWELSEIADEFEVALAFHGWRLDDTADEAPPLLTEPLDGQA
jgi:hypothetical protein